MKTKDFEVIKKIMEYIYHNTSPSTMRIKEQMGISRGTAHKQLAKIDE